MTSMSCSREDLGGSRSHLKGSKRSLKGLLRKLFVFPEICDSCLKNAEEILNKTGAGKLLLSL